MATLMRDRATGKTASIAQMQADRQMGQAAAEQSSAAASARGPAALALAQQGSAANTAAMQSNISGQAQINAANERLQAEQAAFGAYSGVRSGDATLQAQDAHEGEAQAQLNAAQRSENDRMQLGMTGFEVGVNNAQLGAQGNQVNIESGAANAAANRASAESMHSSDRFDKYAAMAAGGVGAVGSALLMNALGGGGGAKSDPSAPDVGDSVGSDAGEQVGGAGSEQSGSGFDPLKPPPDSDARTKNIGSWDSLMARRMGGGVGDSTPMAASNRALAAQPYEYKPENAARNGQAPGEQNVGPMAQNMASDPVARTAVETDPQTGTMVLNRDKLAKVTAGGVADLQQQVDQLKASLMARRIGGGR